MQINIYIYIYINLTCYTNKDRENWEEKGIGEDRVSQRERERERERERVLPVGDGGGVRCGFGLKVSGGLERRRFLVLWMRNYGVNECTSTCVCGLCFSPFFLVTLPFGLCVFLLFKVGWACVCFPSPLLGPIYFPPLFHFNKLYLP